MKTIGFAPRLRWLSAAVLLCAALLHSQTFTGTISGIVSDGSGAVLTGAAITVTDLAKNTTQRTATNETGFYVTSGLAPGVYRITAEKSGFRTYVLDSMPLSTQQKASIDITLDIGAVTENVQVQAQAQMVDPSSSTLGTVVENKRIIDLPLNGRQIYSLAALVPGVFNVRTGSDGMTADFTSAHRFIVNGGQESTTDILLDGVTALVSSNNSTLFSVGAIPSVEGVQEFKIQTNAFSAEYGRSGGGLVTMVTKSGSNELHGSAFEFLRNSYFDANNFFANRNGTKLASFKRNQFGATVGGPVFVPRVYNGRNKTFFFFIYEGQRVLQGRLDQETVPTALERAGDFSKTLNAAGAMRVVFDPFTTRASPDAAGKFIRDPFAGNKLPTNRLDPVALNAQKFYPTPNAAGLPFTGQLNFITQQTRLEPSNRAEFKIDHIFNDRKRMFGRFTRLGSNFGAPNYWGNPAGPGNGVMFQTLTNGALDYTDTLNNSTVLNLRYGLSRLHAFRPAWGTGFRPSSLGLPASMDAVGDELMYPVINVQDYATQGGATGAFFRSGNTTHSFLGNVSKVHGRHSLKFGVDSRLQFVNFGQLFDPGGLFAFQRDMTQGPDPRTPTGTGGVGYASFLLGTGSSGLITHEPQPALANRYLGWYAQDDFKVGRKLTVNIGFRWDFETGATERYNRITGIDPFVQNPLSRQVGLDLHGGYLFAGSTLGGRQIRGVDPHEMNPRLGFAYELNSKTVIRSGYGIFFGIPSYGPSNYWSGAPFRSNTPWLSTLDGITPNYTLSNPFPNGYSTPQGPAGGLLAGVGLDLATGWPSSLKPGYNQQWNFTIQRSFGKDTVWEIAYAGNKGTHVPLYANFSASQPNMNQLRPEQLKLGNQLLGLVANPFFGFIKAGALSQPTVQLGQLLRPFPQFNVVEPLDANWGNSNYHALQTRFEKRFSAGLSLLVSYTWSKTITDGNDGYWNKTDGNMTNWYCRSCDRAVSSYDQPHRFVSNFTYELPFGRGKTLGKSWNGAVNALLGGWQANGILTLSKGLPLRFSVPQNTSFSFGGGQRPDTTGVNADLGDKKTIAKWFDTNQFTQPQPFTFGNLARNTNLRGSSLKQMDVSLFKSFPVKERLKIQFRGEAFNVANHPLFSDPGTQLGSGTFGVVTGQENSPRQIQLSLKLLF